MSRSFKRFSINVRCEDFIACHGAVQRDGRTECKWFTCDKG